MASYQGSARGASADPRRATVEQSEVPILCQTCLGPNPYVRMLKEGWGRECSVCTRPFTVFRWKPGGQGTRFKKTEICQTCAQLKNVCQTCLLDLQYGLPVQVRDLGMAQEDRQAVVVPKSDANREYFADQAERAIENGDIDEIYKDGVENAAVHRLARRGPGYERNQARVCTFWARGECRRGYYCPYRHELSKEGGELSEQNLKDRYYGVNDPVADKMLQQVKGEFPGQLQKTTLHPPENGSIRSVFVGGITPLMTEDEVRSLFAPFGGIESIRLLPNKSIGFVQYGTRASAEAATETLHGMAELSGVKLNIQWARPRRGDELLPEPERPGEAADATQPVDPTTSMLPVQETGAVEDAGGDGADEGGRLADGGLRKDGNIVVGEDESGAAVDPRPAELGMYEEGARRAAPGKAPKSKSALPPPLFYPSQKPRAAGGVTPGRRRV